MKRLYAVAFLVFCALAIGLAVIRPALLARSVTKSIIALEPQQLTKAQVRKWAEQHSGKIYEADQKYSAIVEIDNTILNALHLAPRTRFEAGIQMAGEKPVQASIALHDETRWGASTTIVWAYDPKAMFDFELGEYRLFRNPIGKAPAATLVVNDGLAGDVRNIAGRGLNLKCLARVGGCTGPQQAPEIWSIRR
jgi:hypothetical protein